MDVFDSKSGNCIIPEHPVMSVCHHLPKTHKGLDPLQGRPIISRIGSLNERLGQYLDGVLQPLVTTLPSHFKDTNHLLNIVHYTQWDAHAMWISCDVSSLYSSIPHGLAIISSWILLGT